MQFRYGVPVTDMTCHMFNSQAQHAYDYPCPAEHACRDSCPTEEAGVANTRMVDEPAKEEQEQSVIEEVAEPSTI